MNCKELSPLIDQYVDNELNSKEIAAIEKHLAVCPQCRKEYDETLEFKAVLQSLPLEELPEGFDAELRTKLEEASKEVYGNKIKLIRRPAFRSLVAAAAAVFVFAMAGLTVKFYSGMQKNMNAKSEGAGFDNQLESSPEDIKALTCDEYTGDSDGAKAVAPERTSETPGRGEYEPTYIAPPETSAPHPATTCATTATTLIYQNTVEIIVSVSEPEVQLALAKEFALRNNASVKASDSTYGGGEDQSVTNWISFMVNKSEYNVLSGFLEENYNSVNVSYKNAEYIDLLESETEEITVVLFFK